MSRTRVVALLGVLAVAPLAACELPRPKVKGVPTDGVTQACPSSDCTQIPLQCRTWISIRVVDPARPLEPYISICDEVPLNKNKDLCSIGVTEIVPKPGADPIPAIELEVQVALFPEHMVSRDPDTGEDLCPTAQYDATSGFPVESGLIPALGGRAFYSPGDEIVSVPLGCTNLELVNDPVCTNTTSVRVLATVDDFDTRTSVVPFEANRLALAVGEPQFDGVAHVLRPPPQDALLRTVTIPPAWARDLDHLFSTYSCLTVLEDVPQSSTTVTCQPASTTKSEYSFPSTGAPPGIRMTKSTLDQILGAVGQLPFPARGITIGLVLDRDGRPLANQTVSASPGTTIRYLSADRMSAGGTRTSASGVFVATDAPFPTVFSATNGIPPETPTGIGGQIEGKVSVVILRFNGPVIGGS